MVYKRKYQAAIKMSQPTEADAAVTGNPMSQCRACLGIITANLRSQDIFEQWKEKQFTDTTIAAEMAKVANVEVADVNGYPRHVCHKCLNRLKSAIPFVKDVKTSQELLRNRLHNVELNNSDQTWPKPIQLDKNLNGEVLRNSMDVEVKQEVISDDECRDGDIEMDDEHRQDNLSMLDIKVEPEQIIGQPAIQVTVNDSESTKKVINSEDTEFDPLSPISSERRQSSRPNRIPRTELDGLNESEVAEKHFYHNNFQKELRVSMTRMDNHENMIVTKTHLDNQDKFVNMSKTLNVSKPYSKKKKNENKCIQKIGPPCNCRNNCGSKISDKQRQNICDYYNNASIVKQRAFVINFANEETKCTHSNNAKIKKNCNCKYYLPLTTGQFDNAKIVQVCKEMFVNTLSSKHLYTNRVWRTYKNLKMIDGWGRKTDADVITSVCDHFTQLQNEKVQQLSEISSGVRKDPINKLTFNKMFNLYRDWVVSTNYFKTARSFTMYKAILLKNIPLDHIQTLRKVGNNNMARQKYIPGSSCDPNVYVLTKYENGESEDPGSSQNRNLIDIEIEATNNGNKMSSSEETSKQSVLWKDDDSNYKEDDENDHCDSEVSNFSEDFKEDQKYASKSENSNKKLLKNKFLQDSESDTTEESANEDLDVIRNTPEIREIKRSTRKSGRKCDEDIIKKNEIDDTNNVIKEKGELLTAKLKKPIRDPAVIRKYCKYYGLAYETDSGRIIPKKVLGKSCQNICKKQCATKMSQDQRQFVFNHFWSLGNKKKQMMFMCNFTERVYTKTFRANVNKHRDYSFRYFLPTTSNLDNKSARIRVCVTMFINTLASSYLLPKRAWIEYDKKNKQPSSSIHREININTSKDKTGQIENNKSTTKGTEKNQIDGKKAVKKSVNKLVDSNEDHTTIDFVYRAMPFEEYMAHFGREKNLKLEPFVNGEDKSIKPKKKQDIMKIKRSLGKSYISAKTGKIITEKTMGPVCSCKRECFKIISEDQRRFLFEYFWALGSICKQRAFIVRFSTKDSPKSWQRDLDPSKRREQRFNYYLPITEDFDGDKERVCLLMFLNTLAFTQRAFSVAWAKYKQGQFYDNRGQKKTVSRMTEKYTSVRDHYNFLRKEDPDLKTFKIYNKQYPDGAYNPVKIFKHYNEWFDLSVYSQSSKIEKFKQFEYIFQRVRTRSE